MRAPTIQQFRNSFGSWAEGLPGKWKGDAYRYHPHGVIARPMIYTDHHNTSGTCDAQVMTDKTAKFKPRGEGREASIGNGPCPNPIPETGELVTVYRNGEWVGPDGPWRRQMRDDMARTLKSIRAIERARRLEAERRRAEQEDRRCASYAAAASAFR